MVHKILTDYRDDGIIEVAIDLSDSPLGEFDHTAYVNFHADGSVTIPFSGDRRVIVSADGVEVRRENDVLAHFNHEEV